FPPGRNPGPSPTTRPPFPRAPPPTCRYESRTVRPSYSSPGPAWRPTGTSVPTCTPNPAVTTPTTPAPTTRTNRTPRPTRTTRPPTPTTPTPTTRSGWTSPPTTAATRAPPPPSRGSSVTARPSHWSFTKSTPTRRRARRAPQETASPVSRSSSRRPGPDPPEPHRAGTGAG